MQMGTLHKHFFKNFDNSVKKKIFMAPFYGSISTAPGLEPLQGASLLLSFQKFRVLILLTPEGHIYI